MAERVDLPDTPIIPDIPVVPGGTASSNPYWTVRLYLQGIFDFDVHLKEVTVYAERPTGTIISGDEATVGTSKLIPKISFDRTSEEAKKMYISLNNYIYLLGADQTFLENDTIYLDFSYDGDYESSTSSYSKTLGKPSEIGLNIILLQASTVLKERSQPKAKYFVWDSGKYVGFDHSSAELGAEKVEPAYNLQTGLYTANMFSTSGIAGGKYEKKDLLYNNYEAYDSAYTNFQKDNCIKLPYYYNFRGQQKQVCLVKEGYLPKPFDFYFNKETIQYTPFSANNKLVCLNEAGWLNNNNYTSDMHSKKTWPKDRILQIDRKSAYKKVNNTYVPTNCIAVWDITDPTNKTYEYFSDADHIYYITVSGYVEFFGTNHNVFSKIGYVPKCLTAIMCGGGGGGSTRLMYARDAFQSLPKDESILYASGAAGAGAAWCGFILDFGDNKNTFEIHLGCYGEASQVGYTDIYNTYEQSTIKKLIENGNGWDGQKSYVYNIAPNKDKYQLATFGGQAGHIERITDEEDALWKNFKQPFYKTANGVNGKYNKHEDSPLGTVKATTDGGNTWEDIFPGANKSELESCGIYYITGELGGSGGSSGYELYNWWTGEFPTNLEAWMGNHRGNVTDYWPEPVNIYIYKAASCCYISNDSGKGGYNYIAQDDSSAPGGGGSLGHGGNADEPTELCGYLGGGGAGVVFNINGSSTISGTGGRGALWLFY